MQYFEMFGEVLSNNNNNNNNNKISDLSEEIGLIQSKITTQKRRGMKNREKPVYLCSSNGYCAVSRVLTRRRGYVRVSATS
jgi:hypothetical protein